MNYDLIRAVRTSSKATTPTARYVHLVMATYADENGIAWPSTTRITADSGLSRSTVYASLRQLRRDGCLMRVPAIKGGVQSVFYEVQPGGVRVLDGSACWTPPVRVADKTRPAAGPKVLKKNKRTAHEESFAAFYALYPKKRGRQEALAAWRKLAPDADLVARILASVEAHAKTRDWTKDGGAFIPWPQKFLKAARWEDEIGEAAVALGNRELPDVTAWRRDCRHAPVCSNRFEHEAKEQEVTRVSA